MSSGIVKPAFLRMSVLCFLPFIPQQQLQLLPNIPYELPREKHHRFWWRPVTWPVCTCCLTRYNQMDIKDTYCLAFPWWGYLFTPLACVLTVDFLKSCYKWNYLWDFYPSFKSAWNKPEISVLREEWTNRWTDTELST